MIVTNVGIVETTRSSGFYQDEHEEVAYKIKIEMDNNWYIGEVTYTLEEALKFRDDELEIIRG